MWLVPSTLSEPYIPLRGAMEGSSGTWEDPGAPRGQRLGTAAITGN